MNWLDYKDLAIGLRNQGLADCVAARCALRPGTINILGSKTTLAHMVVAKSQQSVEKLMKGYLLWHSRSFDPAKGAHSLYNGAAIAKQPTSRIRRNVHKAQSFEPRYCC